MFLVNMADESYLEKKSTAEERRLRVYSSNEEIRHNNEEASHILKKRGCKLWNLIQVKYFELEIKGRLEVADDNVIQIFGNGEKQSYNATENTCDCSFFNNNQMVCPHIIFQRKLLGRKLFDTSLFHERWLRRDHHVETGYNVNEGHVDIVRESSEIVTREMSMGNKDTAEEFSNYRRDDVNLHEESEEIVIQEFSFGKVLKPKSLDDRSKYKVAKPILDKIGELLVNHTTNTFLSHIEGLKIIESNIRNGKEIFEVKDNCDVEDEELTKQKFNRKSRFADIKFQPKLKTKGRPKKRSKTLVFNKTKADRGFKRISNNNKNGDSADLLNVVSNNENNNNKVDNNLKKTKAARGVKRKQTKNNKPGEANDTLNIVSLENTNNINTIDDKHNEDDRSKWEETHDAVQYLKENKHNFPNTIEPYIFNDQLKIMFKQFKLNYDDDVEGEGQYSFLGSDVNELNLLMDRLRNICNYKKTNFELVQRLEGDCLLKHFYNGINVKKGNPCDMNDEDFNIPELCKITLDASADCLKVALGLEEESITDRKKTRGRKARRKI